MGREKIGSQLACEPWPSEEDWAVRDKRSQNAMRMIELAHTLAVAETAVLTGDNANAVVNLKRLQASTLLMLADLDHALPELVEAV